MSDTPRMDAIWAQNYCSGGDAAGKTWDMIRDLDRELAATQAQRDKARNDALEEAARVCDSEASCEGIAQKCAAAIRAMKECGK